MDSSKTRQNNRLKLSKYILDYPRIICIGILSFCADRSRKGDKILNTVLD